MRGIKTSFILPIVAVTIAGAVFGASNVFAQDNDTGGKTIVQRLAERFNLKESDVQAVFDEARSEHHALMKTRLEERLTQLVNDGKITETQKQAILKKMEELKSKYEANHETLKNMTIDERMKAKEDLKKELEAFEKEYGLDLQTLFGIGKGHFGFRVGGHFMTH